MHLFCLYIRCVMVSTATADVLQLFSCITATQNVFLSSLQSCSKLYGAKKWEAACTIIIWGSTGEKGEMMVMGQHGTKTWETYNDFISSLERPSSKPQTCIDSVGGGGDSTCPTYNIPEGVLESCRF